MNSDDPQSTPDDAPPFSPPMLPVPPRVTPRRNAWWARRLVRLGIGFIVICCALGIVFYKAGQQADSLNQQIDAGIGNLATLPPGQTNNPISNVKLGTGERATGAITRETNTFQPGETIIVSFTGTTQETGASASLTLVTDTQQQVLQRTTLAIGSHPYFFAFSLSQKGAFIVTVSFNDTVEQTLPLVIQ